MSRLQDLCVHDDAERHEQSSPLVEHAGSCRVQAACVELRLFLHSGHAGTGICVNRTQTCNIAHTAGT